MTPITRILQEQQQSTSTTNDPPSDFFNFLSQSYTTFVIITCTFIVLLLIIVCFLSHFLKTRYGIDCCSSDLDRRRRLRQEERLADENRLREEMETRTQELEMKRKRRRLEAESVLKGCVLVVKEEDLVDSRVIGASESALLHGGSDDDDDDEDNDEFRNEECGEIGQKKGNDNEESFKQSKIDFGVEKDDSKDDKELGSAKISPSFSGVSEVTFIQKKKSSDTSDINGEHKNEETDVESGMDQTSSFQLKTTILHEEEKFQDNNDNFLSKDRNYTLSLYDNIGDDDNDSDDDDEVDDEDFLKSARSKLAQGEKGSTHSLNSNRSARSVISSRRVSTRSLKEQLDDNSTVFSSRIMGSLKSFSGSSRRLFGGAASGDEDDVCQEEEGICLKLPPRSPASSPRYVEAHCAICLGVYEVGDEVIWSPNPSCEHVFHEDCILCWISRGKQRCPCCRLMFVKKVEENDD